VCVFQQQKSATGLCASSRFLFLGVKISELFLPAKRHFPNCQRQGANCKTQVCDLCPPITSTTDFQSDRFRQPTPMGHFAQRFGVANFEHGNRRV